MIHSPDFMFDMKPLAEQVALVMGGGRSLGQGFAQSLTVARLYDSVFSAPFTG